MKYFEVDPVCQDGKNLNESNETKFKI